MHERDVKKVKHAVQRIKVYFNYISRFENELTSNRADRNTADAGEIEEARKEKSNKIFLADFHRNRHYESDRSVS